MTHSLSEMPSAGNDTGADATSSGDIQCTRGTLAAAAAAAVAASWHVDHCTVLFQAHFNIMMITMCAAKKETLVTFV